MFNVIISKGNDEKHYLPKQTKLLLHLFMYLTFFGPYFLVFGVSISNIFSFLLIFIVFHYYSKRSLLFIRNYLLFFLFLIVYSLSTLLWTKETSLGLSILFPLVTSYLAMLFVSILNKKHITYFLYAIYIFTLIIVIFSLFEIITGNYVFFENKDFIFVLNKYGYHYPGVVFANPNDLAQYLAIVSPIIIFMKTNKKKYFNATVLFIVIMFIMINSTSRMALLSFLISIFIYLALSFKATKLNFKQFKKILILLLFIFIFSLFINLEFWTERVLRDFLTIDFSMDYVTGRNHIYLSALEVGQSNILFGSGLGSSYKATLIGPHSMLLFIFSDFGILFFLGLIVVLVFSAKDLFKYRKFSLNGFYISKICLSILIAFPVFSSISSGNEQRKIIWIFLGLVFATINIYKIQYRKVSGTSL